MQILVCSIRIDRFAFSSLSGIDSRDGESRDANFGRFDSEFAGLQLCGGTGAYGMVEESALHRWFCDEVLPMEPALIRFIRRNWRDDAEVTDLRQEIYERALVGARAALPGHTRHYLYTVARNHLVNRAKRAQIVSFELVADMSSVKDGLDWFETERQLNARDDLRRAEAGLNRLPPRCREVVMLRKVEGLTTRETAERLGISVNTVEKQMTQGMKALVNFMLGGAGRIRRRPSRHLNFGRGAS